MSPTPEPYGEHSSHFLSHILTWLSLQKVDVEFQVETLDGTYCTELLPMQTVDDGSTKYFWGMTDNRFVTFDKAERFTSVVKRRRGTNPK